ncbi:unnamed protein product [Rotaria sp. Silwood1]|nr:unnamed protein product [Rotaria sp. Silwood1]
MQSLTRFFYDTRITLNNSNISSVNEEEYLTAEHTIDDLYNLAYPEYNELQVAFNSLPLKFVVDDIITQNVLTDFNDKTKKLAAAHFDDEAFINASKRILQFRQIIINNMQYVHQDLSYERELLGQLIHTLQDFYSHSNWIEMGKTNINEFIGVNETIGLIAQPNQTTSYPEYNELRVAFYSLPIKFVVDDIITQNVLTDFNDKTKKLAAAHFDNEAFINASKRILQFRQIIINNMQYTNQDLSYERELLGQLIHTLQDFYSHSNWIEMGKTNINEFIGVNETIGLIAQPNQTTCTNNGCTKIETPCNLWQEITVGVCPLVYYDCKNNILPEINDQQLLTSGYAANDMNENNEIIEKPTNVEKCSHGSVLDDSSHIPAIGGINKDSYSLVYSPHADLHKKAADLAIKATERFLNDLRQDLGDKNFDRLFVINPTETQCQIEWDSMSKGKRFRFFSSDLTAYIKDDGRWLIKLKRFFRRLFRLIKSIWIRMFTSKENINQPTYDLSDKGVNVKDVNNFRAAPYVIGKEELRRKKRMIYLARKRRYL